MWGRLLPRALPLEVFPEPSHCRTLGFATNADNLSPSPGGEGRGEGGQPSWIASTTKIFALPFLLLFFFATFLCTIHSAAAADLAFFESKIRPLLAEHCYSCHSAKAEKLKGGLYVDSLEGLLKGGDLGAALIPGDADKSLLLKAVRYIDADLQMPPKGKKLSDRQIADLTRWVKAGAPWPETDQAAVRPAKASHEITGKDRSWWAFQPVRRPTKSETVNSGSVISKDTARGTGSLNTDPLITDHSIDAFIRAELDAKKLKPNPPATKRELIRRAYFDLIGLPPTPEQVAAFEKDKSPDAWPRLIDELLARPQYGERWGRHWLDVARFAQSNGYERDGEKPESWRYRDYVVKAFNEDKPYDQFIKEQIAGDELERVTFDSIIAWPSSTSSMTCSPRPAARSSA
jgi:mono/diheme cytochrome c family protein